MVNYLSKTLWWEVLIGLVGVADKSAIELPCPFLLSCGELFVEARRFWISKLLLDCKIIAFICFLIFEIERHPGASVVFSSCLVPSSSKLFDFLAKHCSGKEHPECSVIRFMRVCSIMPRPSATSLDRILDFPRQLICSFGGIEPSILQEFIFMDVSKFLKYSMISDICYQCDFF